MKGNRENTHHPIVDADRYGKTQRCEIKRPLVRTLRMKASGRGLCFRHANPADISAAEDDGCTPMRAV